MFFLLFSAVALFMNNQSYALECRDESNNTVDSWYAFKLNKGTQYLYADTKQPTPVLSQYDMNSTKNGALAYTTMQLWVPETAYILYNDEPPTQNPELTPGHTKGYAAVAPDSSGFLVIHSIPKFPTGPGNISQYIGMESNAWEYGQSILCLSLNASTIAAVLTKMQSNAPQVYDWATPTQIPQTAINAIQALGSGVINTSALCTITTYETQASMEFQYFAKSKQWNNELYAACIAPYYQQSFYVESWIRGSAEGPSCTTPNHVYDIQELDYNGFKLSEYNDHSKWAVSDSIVCIGDINRMTTQYSRGGGSVCFESPLAAFLRQAIVKADGCA
jgi:deoxyribonuclease II